MNRVGRADLLALLDRLGKEGMEQAAPCVGFYRRPKKPSAAKPKKEVYAGDLVTPFGEDKIEHRFDETEPTVQFWRVVEYRGKSEAETQTDEPLWFKEEISFSSGEVRADYSQTMPSKQPLLPWSRMWPFLFGVLGFYCDTRSIDMERVVERVARAGPVGRLPMEQRLTWAGTCQVILDMDERLLPFWDDETGLLQGIERLRGSSGLEVLVFENGPQGLCRRWGKELGELRPYRLPAPGSPILVISDLGCLDIKQKFLQGGPGGTWRSNGKNVHGGDTSLETSYAAFALQMPPHAVGPPGRRRHSWQRFGKRLKRAGFLPVALTPCPSRLWDVELCRYWRLVCWDRGERLPRPDKKQFFGSRLHHGLLMDAEPGTQRLLGLLSAAIRVEPALLRAVRLLLPHGEADVGTEAAVWGHEHIHTSPIAFAFERDAIAHYRDLFKSNTTELKARVVDCIKKYHAHLSPAVRAEEDLVGAELLGKDAESSWGHQFMKRVVKTQHNKHFNQRENLGEWLNRISGRMHRKVWETDSVLTAAWLIRNRDAWEKGRLTPPPGMDIQKAAWVFGRRWEPVEWVLRRRGGVFIMDRDGWVTGETANGWSDRGSPAAKLTLGNPWLKVGIRGRGADEDYVLNVEARQLLEIPVPGQGQVILDTDHEQVVIDSFTGLDWADSIGCDGFGIYAEFSINEVVQRMRLVIPGEFMMGSPENEPERYDDERLHKVIISRGFWLADTACTQALWQAVTGENPSYFKGDQRPVENVSWNDCRAFIEKIDGLKPGLELRLPTEAEWEYACRAGTITPFWFGENITPEQVNYDGKNPYAGGKKGKFREETVDVKSLPCNGWGLYQMHGNVLEWCSDWFGDYPLDSVIDPVGPPGGTFRVVRGGCWFDLGRLVRSADRFRLEPSIRFSYTGFRLARGHK